MRRQFGSPPRQQCLEKVGPSDRCSRRGDDLDPLLPVVLSRESVNERYIPSKTSSSVFVSPHKTQNPKPKFSKLENFLSSSHRVLGQNIAQPCDVTSRAISKYGHRPFFALRSISPILIHCLGFLLFFRTERHLIFTGEQNTLAFLYPTKL